MISTGKSSKYALVTGGSSGMGLEYVKILASKGYSVVIAALYQQETDAVAAMLRPVYPLSDFISVGIDLSAADSAVALYGIIRKSIPPNTRVEVLVNNAGVLYPMHFRNMSLEQVSRIIMLHNHTPAMLCSLYLPEMLASGKGYILNISSLAAWIPWPFLTTYSSTKAFTKVFTRALRTECRGTGVKVSTVYFGAVDTGLLGLTPRQRKLARSLRIMLPAEKAASIAMKMMFSGRSGRIPGLVNKIARVFVPLLPHSLLSAIERKVTARYGLK